MLTVTARAMKKLEEKLRDLTANPRIAFRMTALSLSPVRVFLMLDDEREDDRVVESLDGRKVLFINADIAKHLRGMTVDHQPSEEMAG
jgi:hypothetical protein